MSIRGVHQTNEPFVIQVFAAEGECLRLEVDSETQDSVAISFWDWAPTQVKFILNTGATPAGNPAKVAAPGAANTAQD